MSSPALLFWGIVFSSVGFGYFIYGKKQKKLMPMLCGFCLMAYPYFVSSIMLLVAIGVVLSVPPYFVEL